MKADFSRRKLMKAVGATALLTPLTHGADVPELRGEGRDTPKICLEMGEGRLSAGSPDEPGMRRVNNLVWTMCSWQARRFPGGKIKSAPSWIASDRAV